MPLTSFPAQVYRAYDLHEHREVACKMHQISPHWSAERTASYTRHVTREYAIHKELSHDRVVALHDVFEIDAHTFATVLQFCNGGDLDGLLKEQRTLPEKEARAILAQVCCGLAYLQSRRVIHFDLKPANILFHNGEVKLTDFGLSKVLDAGSTALGMELTSQGAGTYWYLPPECFDLSGSRPPTICPKVDVWSAGVCFYQVCALAISDTPLGAPHRPCPSRAAPPAPPGGRCSTGRSPLGTARRRRWRRKPFASRGQSTSRRNPPCPRKPRPSSFSV